VRSRRRPVPVWSHHWWVGSRGDIPHAGSCRLSHGMGHMRGRMPGRVAGQRAGQHAGQLCCARRGSSGSSSGVRRVRESGNAAELRRGGVRGHGSRERQGGRWMHGWPRNQGLKDAPGRHSARSHGGAQGAVGPQVQSGLQHLDSSKPQNCCPPCMLQLPML
jgi:hypothetical protein